MNQPQATTNSWEIAVLAIYLGYNFTSARITQRKGDKQRRDKYLFAFDTDQEELDALQHDFDTGNLAVTDAKSLFEALRRLQHVQVLANKNVAGAWGNDE